MFSNEKPGRGYVLAGLLQQTHVSMHTWSAEEENSAVMSQGGGQRQARGRKGYVCAGPRSVAFLIDPLCILYSGPCI